ncbi:unnamed protein product [Dibothriocephalus latus]|uniref:Uncharacterized protein n=1 Tax=Dibothriocephalus latus TaxID=60516 RepID=A0A3P7NHV6_DIBLA|nr:unnamed protein product [Dibothriocephalus latus]
MDAVLAVHFRAGIRGDYPRCKLIKKPHMTSDQFLSLVQNYEDRYGQTPRSLTRPAKRASLGGDPHLSQFRPPAPGTPGSGSRNFK